MAAFLIRAGPPLFYVAHHADDFSLHIELFQMDALPDRVFLREPGARKNVIDVDHHGGALVVLRSDEAAPLARTSKANRMSSKNALFRIMLDHGFTSGAGHK